MRFLYFFSLFLLTQNGIAQNYSYFDQRDYQTIMERSKKEKKPVFLILYANWCSHCAKMKNEVLKDSVVSKLLDRNFICTAQDIDKREGMILKNKFGVTSYPTFIILDASEQELYRLKGEYKTPEFIAEIKNAMNPKKQLSYLKKEFEAEPSNAQKWINYMNVLKKGRSKTEFSELANKYLSTQTDEQLVSENNWLIIANCVTDISSREFQYVLQHQKEFEAVSSPERVERKKTNIVNELLTPLIKSLDTTNYYKQRKIAQTIPSQKVDSLLFRYDITISERTKNWEEYKKVTIADTEKYAWNDATLLKEIARDYYNNIPDIPSLKYAIKWTNRSLELNNSLDGNILLSNLYIKINDKRNAVKHARKSKELCNLLGFDPKDVDELYTKLNIK